MTDKVARNGDRVRDHRNPDVRDYRNNRPDIRDHRDRHRYVRDDHEEYQRPVRRRPDPWSTEVDSILSDPGVSIQDKLAFLFAKIAGKLDDDIEKKIEEVRRRQGESENASGDKKGSAGQAVDIAVTDLNRSVTKRKDFVDLFRSVIDKYNETVVGMLQSLGK